MLEKLDLSNINTYPLTSILIRKYYTTVSKLYNITDFSLSPTKNNSYGLAFRACATDESGSRFLYHVGVIIKNLVCHIVIQENRQYTFAEDTIEEFFKDNREYDFCMYFNIDDMHKLEIESRYKLQKGKLKRDPESEEFTYNLLLNNCERWATTLFFGIEYESQKVIRSKPINLLLEGMLAFAQSHKDIINY